MRLAGKRVIALVEDDYEDLELWYPVLRLREEGAEVVVAGLGAEVYHGKYGLPAEPDANVDDLDMRDFDAILVVGGWVPASAGVLKGRTMTCTPGIKDDVMNAGAHYVDEPVVVDGNLVTARRPPDLPAYGAALVEALS